MQVHVRSTHRSISKPQDINPRSFLTLFLKTYRYVHVQHHAMNDWNFFLFNFVSPSSLHIPLSNNLSPPPLDNKLSLRDTVLSPIAAIQRKRWELPRRIKHYPHLAQGSSLLACISSSKSPQSLRTVAFFLREEHHAIRESRPLGDT